MKTFTLLVFSHPHLKYVQSLVSFSDAVIMSDTTFETLEEFLECVHIFVLTCPLTDKYSKQHVTSTLRNGLQIAEEIGCDRVFVIGDVHLLNDSLRSPYLSTIYISSDNTLAIKPPNIVSTITIRKDTVSFLKHILARHEEFQYLDLIREVLTTGSLRKTRNGNVKSVFGKQLTFDLTRFPLYTTKKMFLRGIFEELKFFLLGYTDSKLLEQKGVNIWKGNTSREFLDTLGFTHRREGDMGPMYFFNVLHYGTEYIDCETDYQNRGFNQFEYVLHQLRTDPNSRRIIFTTYNPLNAHQGVLFPCHGLLTQFYVEDQRLSCSVTLRSNDLICGNPFNVASYALLVYIMCQLLDNKYQPGKLILHLNDVHIYEPHFDVAKEQLCREPYPFPRLSFRKQFFSVQELNWEDIILEEYQSYPSFKVHMIP